MANPEPMATHKAILASTPMASFADSHGWLRVVSRSKLALVVTAPTIEEPPQVKVHALVTMEGSMDQSLGVQSAFPLTFVFGSASSSSLSVGKGPTMHDCCPSRGRGKRVGVAQPDSVIGRKRARTGPLVQEVRDEDMTGSAISAPSQDI